MARTEWEVRCHSLHEGRICNHPLGHVQLRDQLFVPLPETRVAGQTEWGVLFLQCPRCAGVRPWEAGRLARFHTEGTLVCPDCGGQREWQEKRRRRASFG